MIPGKQYTPELVLATAWRRKWLILIPTVVIGAAASASTYMLPDQYRAETTILVVPQRIPENYIKSTVTTRVEDRLRSINSQVRSRTRLEQVIEEFDLYAERRQTDIMQNIVDDMNNSIGVDIVQGDVFRVAFTAGDPGTAMKVANRLTQFFIDDSLKDRSSAADGTSRFIESELELAARTLRENEQQLVAYRLRHDGELPTQVDANMRGMDTARMQQQALRSTIEQARELQLELTSQIKDLAEAVEAASVAGVVAQEPEPPGSAAAQLQSARADLQRFLLRVRPDHPDVRRFEEAIADLERKAELEASQVPLTPKATPNTSAGRRQKELDEAKDRLERVNRNIDNHVAEQRALDRTIADYQRKLNAAPGRDSELVDLLRNYNTLKTQYDSLLAKKLDSNISANLERQQIGETFRVLDPARLPERPSSPDRPRQYAFGMMFAIAVGLALAGGAEYLDRGLRSEDDVRLALALPVLATIPVIGPKQQPKKSRKLLARFASAVILLAVTAGAIWYTRG